MKFDDLGLRAVLLRAAREQGYTIPTPVQARAIPVILCGRDLMAAAQTGTGKTAAFVFPMLQRLMGVHGGPSRSVRALVVVPTRELASQVAASVRTYGAGLPFRCAVVFGGVGLQPQIEVLRRGVDIVVATPGRLLDHVDRGSIDLRSVEILVLDEADRMLDMGFIHDIRRVLALLPARRQNLLFSATFPNEIRALAGQLLENPEVVDAGRPNSTPVAIEQIVYRVDRERKTELLVELVRGGGWTRALVFTRTKHGANRLAEKLGRAGITAEAIHGNKSQSARTRALEGFKAGRVRTLVATEVAARGLDIADLQHVVNYELPLVPEDYVHRIGRTGRAGESGQAVSLLCIDEVELLAGIERVLGRTLRIQVVTGFEPDPAIRPTPITKGKTGQNRNRKGVGSAPRTAPPSRHAGRRRAP